ncbi:hypothetical protein SAMD00019534_095600 [Acytostelium subglobosum LB1]|uniref:hypothetical protein n=1 Tax=Acytostelium subglobosum LB1 TaxID=1410327 RepID=UPI000644C4EA|nr:hypothetical protein SAMD00019534_095600 [Acytostelium subglobosum LB1]GAM26385.1 hypothetical protein SAMD00019534_095600 [Acytostelium subglobosum LB1]|eukprot:XP_012750481.1 hypothetical protein SAMD00019534_095600 [Acytostelium subglobosum LB1]
MLRRLSSLPLAAINTVATSGSQVRYASATLLANSPLYRRINNNNNSSRYGDSTTPSNNNNKDQQVEEPNASSTGQQKETVSSSQRPQTSSATPHFVQVDDRSGGTKWVPVPREIVIYPVFETQIYPGSLSALLPFDLDEYKRMGQPKEIGLFFVNQTEMETLGKDTKQFKLTSMSQLNPIGVLVSVESSAQKPYLIGAARIRLDELLSPVIATPTDIPTSSDTTSIENTTTTTDSTTTTTTETTTKTTTTTTETTTSAFPTDPVTQSIPQPIVTIPNNGENAVPIIDNQPPPVPDAVILSPQPIPYELPRASITYLPDVMDPQSDPVKVRALTLQLVKKVKQLSSMYPDSQFSSQFQMLFGVSRFRFMEEPGKLADFIASICSESATPVESQEIIGSIDIEKRLERVLSLVVKQLQLNEFNALMEKHIEDKAVKQQKKFFLSEQMKLVRRELELDQDEKETLKKKFKARWSQLKVPEETNKVFNDEMERLASIEPTSAEYNVTRNYLEWITSLPWNITSIDNFDIPTIKTVLDNDHYGLDDIKEMIQSFIAVGKLRGSVGGKIILLVGPPGTGKTSIGKSIATALGRQFYRFSVGGISDVAEIKGHRRTFVGAMPGKIIQALKLTKTSNPVILIDEIDKVARGFNEDPYSSLLEVFDPQQNKNYLDHYLDIPYDLSKVLFICTANLTHTIPAPLLDRMEVMKLNGYIQTEQIKITEKYLIPSIRAETGIGEDRVNISTEAVQHLCEYWCRESGVRNLKKTIEKIFRKVAYKMVTEEPSVINITPSNLDEYAGLPKYRIKKYYQTPQPGIALGLGWTENGGMPLYVESVVDRFQQAPGLKTTGSLGEVMKESIDIAFTYVKQYLAQVDPSSKFFENNAVHIHSPEGATPKDGPSAGVTMTTSLLSLALNKPIQPGVAMTGEITLTGKVIAIGGITEKMIAAKREGVKKIILPKDNKKELEDIPDYVKEGFTVYLVDYYNDVFDIAFNETPSVQPLLVVSRHKKDFNKVYPPKPTEPAQPTL